MAVHPMILDNRIHRTIWITTDQTGPLNLVADTENYTVVLKTASPQDQLIITPKDGSPGPGPIPLSGSFVPPHCTSPVGRYDNADCQFAVQIDEKKFRVAELIQNLVDPPAAGQQVMITSATAAVAQPQRSDKLIINYKGFIAEMATNPKGIKVPPDLAS